MNYDMQALYGIVIFFSLYLYLQGTVKVIDFCTQFQIVRLRDIDTLRSQIDELEHDNNLLRRGIFITKEDTGQLTFDLPTDEPEYVIMPPPNMPPLVDVVKDSQGNTISCDYGRQKWLLSDWINYQNGKTLVKRGKNYIWVTDVLNRDTVIKEPYQWIKVYNNGHHTRKVRVR